MPVHFTLTLVIDTEFADSRSHLTKAPVIPRDLDAWWCWSKEQLSLTVRFLYTGWLLGVEIFSEHFLDKMAHWAICLKQIFLQPIPKDVCKSARRNAFQEIVKPQMLAKITPVLVRYLSERTSRARLGKQFVAFLLGWCRRCKVCVGHRWRTQSTAFSHHENRPFCNWVGVELVRNPKLWRGWVAAACSAIHLQLTRSG